MSISKRHLADVKLRAKVVSLYRTTLRPMEQIARDLGITMSTIVEILRQDIPKDELKKIKSLKYSQSKMGDKNPMLGKKPGNTKGDCPDGYGYLTRVIRGKRYFAHRAVMAEMLGIEVKDLPRNLSVHHIDEDPTNNNPNNLALVTVAGHCEIHMRYKKLRNQS